jgi:A/G-specific adenine glycosylase
LPGARPDPYGVWLSEIMLQQTTTGHAAPYFRAFRERWPTVRDLAAADDEEVMAAWAGLGYYARARNLIACARVVADAHRGVFPDTEAALRELPGLGAYTAAAVAAIAFDRPSNVVDGNVERVMARLFAVETPLPGAKPILREFAARLVAPDRPGDWAQALMDLGAMVCRPRRPACDACPLRADCRAFASGDPQAWPRREAKPERPERHGAVFVVRRLDLVGLVRRPPRGLLGGMLGLPTRVWWAAPWLVVVAAAAAPFAGSWRDLGEVGHAFTHFALTLRVLAIQVEDAVVELIWMDIETALDAMPSVFAKALRRALEA